MPPYFMSTMLRPSTLGFMARALLSLSRFCCSRSRLVSASTLALPLGCAAAAATSLTDTSAAVPGLFT